MKPVYLLSIGGPATGKTHWTSKLQQRLGIKQETFSETADAGFRVALEKNMQFAKKYDEAHINSEIIKKQEVLAQELMEVQNELTDSFDRVIEKSLESTAECVILDVPICSTPFYSNGFYPDVYIRSMQDLSNSAANEFPKFLQDIQQKGFHVAVVLFSKTDAETAIKGVKIRNRIGEYEWLTAYDRMTRILDIHTHAIFPAIRDFNKRVNFKDLSIIETGYQESELYNEYQKAIQNNQQNDLGYDLSIEAVVKLLNEKIE